MKLFEHYITSKWDDVISKGEKGWELVAVGQNGYYMKREKTSSVSSSVETEKRIDDLKKEVIGHLKSISDGIDRMNQL